MNASCSISWRIARQLLLRCLAVLFCPVTSWLAAQTQTPNRVLDLDGTDAWVRLPPEGFAGFDQATVEAWVKWRSVTSLAARVFDLGGGRREMYVGSGTGGSGPYAGVMKFLIVDTTGVRRREEVAGGFRVNEWTHVAVVTGPGGARIYLNGVLAAANEFTGSLSALGRSNYYLGRHNYARDAQGPLDGQLDEVRVWSVMRTEEEIRATLSQRLTGSEPGLAGLWNFDDPAQPGRDASPNGFHGELAGDAHSVLAELPAAAEIRQPSVIEGQVSDPDGNPVTAAQVAVASPEIFANRAENPPPPPWAAFGISDAKGRFRIAVFASPESAAVGAFTPNGELYGCAARNRLGAGPAPGSGPRTAGRRGAFRNRGGDGQLAAGRGAARSGATAHIAG